MWHAKKGSKLVPRAKAHKLSNQRLTPSESDMYALQYCKDMNVRRIKL